jgi:hypothetical protein
MRQQQLENFDGVLLCCNKPSKQTKLQAIADAAAGVGLPWVWSAFMPRSISGTGHKFGPPMTLGNMRQNGVRSLAVSCFCCRHEAVVSADQWPDHVPVPTFGRRMVRTRCGAAAEHRRGQEGTGRDAERAAYARQLVQYLQVIPEPARRDRLYDLGSH